MVEMTWPKTSTARFGSTPAGSDADDDVVSILLAFVGESASSTAKRPVFTDR
jgi:hypothetical protein